jgi:hypothetical protein
VLEIHRDDFSGDTMLQLKESCSAEAQRRNDRLAAEFTLVIGVPTEAVLAASIEVQQHAVEGNSVTRFQRAA